MRTAGIDLASQDANTALAVVRWTPGAATLERLDVGVGDAALVDASLTADKVGIDCPFGWPAPFVDFLNDPLAGPPPDWRSSLASRLTDRVVRAATGLVPLSVSTDRIAYPAMRCAGLLGALAARGVEVDRAGAGRVVEVYPAAALRGWGLAHRAYKGTGRRDALDALVDAILGAAPWLDLGDFAETARRHDHATDAVVAALVARASATGRATSPEPSQLSLAATEGWIALPTVPLASLLSG